MSSSTRDQTEDLTEANLELRPNKSLLESAVICLAEPQDISTEVLIEKYAKGDETTVEAVIARISKALAEIEFLSPKGLERLILSCCAVSKVEMEPLRQLVDLYCPKFGLILLLCQKARAPPHFKLLHASPPQIAPPSHTTFQQSPWH